MIIRILILMQLTVLELTDFSQNMWIRQQTPTVKWLNRCTFPDSLNGWAAGEDGVIIRTTNGGNNWFLSDSPVDFFIYDIHFVNPRLGWGVAIDNFASGTAILSTTDGGINWSYYRFPDSTVQLYTIHFKDSLNGLMGGYQGKIFRTTNGGLNWNLVQTDTSFSSYMPVLRISSRHNIDIAAGGTFDILGVMWSSTNNGLTWKSTGITAEPLMSFGILSSTKVVALGGDYDFGVIGAKTYNAGLTWTNEYLNTFGIARGLSFRTQTEAWAVLSISARFLFTLDTGNTWNGLDVPDTIPLYDIIFTDPSHGYAVGEKGGVFRYNSAAIGISGNQNTIPVENMLYQNYPNPFNPYTNIEYTLSAASMVKIIIYDIAGRSIKMIQNSFMTSGTHRLKFDASQLSSGVYFYSITAGDFTETRKMVVLR